MAESVEKELFTTSWNKTFGSKEGKEVLGYIKEYLKISGTTDSAKSIGFKKDDYFYTSGDLARFHVKHMEVILDPTKLWEEIEKKRKFVKNSNKK